MNAARDEWRVAAERMMRGSKAAADPAYGRYIVDLVPHGEAYRTAGYDYLAMLRESIFSLSPQGGKLDPVRLP